MYFYWIYQRKDWLSIYSGNVKQIKGYFLIGCRRLLSLWSHFLSINLLKCCYKNQYALKIQVYFWFTCQVLGIYHYMKNYDLPIGNVARTMLLHSYCSNLDSNLRLIIYDSFPYINLPELLYYFPTPKGTILVCGGSPCMLYLRAVLNRYNHTRKVLAEKSA